MEGKRSWVEIDLLQLKRNYEIYKALQPEGREIMAVVKADAYGHGDKEVASALDSIGVKCFAVSNIDEAIHVRSVTDSEKDVKPGDTIGYGRSYTVKKPMTIATIPTGYADGYSRLLSNKGWVLINGKRANIVGRVCMDQMMVDVSGIDGVGISTEVVLLGQSGDEKITADDLANVYGTIGYEIICGINKRVQRMYLQ